MFPSFPYLAETIAAERAADFQREAAAYRRARGIRRARVTDAVARSHRTRHSAEASHVGSGSVGSGSVGSGSVGSSSVSSSGVGSSSVGSGRVAACVTRTDSCAASRAI
jgi:hypothetical protein